jgi:betaine lipid synthase
MDGIDLGPERRQYLDHQLSRVWECNGQGSIPYVPYLRAPYYVWIGHVPQLATVLSENKVGQARGGAAATGSRPVLPAC